MALKNRRAQKRIVKRPCEMCGASHVGRHAAHVIDEIAGSGGAFGGDWNALSLCPSCHAVFEDTLRPKLYRALKEFGTSNLPPSWAQSNKVARAQAVLEEESVDE
jgi:hypothetical protein